MADRPWQLKGEVTAPARPKNSLLGTALEFESATKVRRGRERDTIIYLLRFHVVRRHECLRCLRRR